MTAIFYALLCFAVLLATLCIIVGLFATYRHYTLQGDGYFVASLLWLIGISAILVVVLAHREYPAMAITLPGAMEDSGAPEETPTFLSSSLGRFLSIFIVLLAAIRFIVGGHFFRSSTSSLRIGEIKKMDPAQLLFTTFFIYFVFYGVLSSIAGTKPALVHWMFYPVIIIGAAFFSPSYDTRFLVKHIKWILLILIYGSLSEALVFPKTAFEHGYVGIIPGLSLRLYGFSEHPNTLGPVALLFLVLDYFSPSPGKVGLLHKISAIAVLLLAQSKTAYIGSSLALLAVLVYRSTANQGSKNKLYLPPLGFLTVLILGAGGIVLTLSVLNFFGKDFFNPFSDVDAKNITFTGRTLIWEITLDRWNENLLFGYGPELWYPEFRAKYGLPVVGQAHNQFIQALGEAGIFGMIGLLLYLFALLHAAIVTAGITRGASLALLVVPLSRTFTETPFRNFVINDWAFFTHLVVFCLLAGWLREKALVTKGQML